MKYLFKYKLKGIKEPKKLKSIIIIILKVIHMSRLFLKKIFKHIKKIIFI